MLPWNNVCIKFSCRLVCSNKANVPCRLIYTNKANVPADLQSAGIKYKDFSIRLLPIF